VEISDPRARTMTYKSSFFYRAYYYYYYYYY